MAVKRGPESNIKWPEYSHSQACKDNSRVTMAGLKFGLRQESGGPKSPISHMKDVSIQLLDSGHIPANIKSRFIRFGRIVEPGFIASFIQTSPSGQSQARAHLHSTFHISMTAP